ncbi:hypothetical protein ACFOEE_00540 [Pseudoalteromonas fenneropenaei]|uniref:Uncharacterized protein n=1 Tax=Pseudoalteromonas fenneropenaei TaxID=1737459 RepID=A0ABV7CC97_9GAMM
MVTSKRSWLFDEVIDLVNAHIRTPNLALDKHGICYCGAYAELRCTSTLYLRQLNILASFIEESALLNGQPLMLEQSSLLCSHAPFMMFIVIRRNTMPMLAFFETSELTGNTLDSVEILARLVSVYECDKAFNTLFGVNAAKMPCDDRRNAPVKQVKNRSVSLVKRLRNPRNMGWMQVTLGTTLVFVHFSLVMMRDWLGSVLPSF